MKSSLHAMEEQHTCGAMKYWTLLCF